MYIEGGKRSKEMKANKSESEPGQQTTIMGIPKPEDERARAE
jgi:hypothetical protein